MLDVAFFSSTLWLTSTRTKRMFLAVVITSLAPSTFLSRGSVNGCRGIITDGGRCRALQCKTSDVLSNTAIGIALKSLILMFNAFFFFLASSV